jgi:hypothetical protein
VLAIGAGAYFGLKTSSTWKQAQDHCDGADCRDQEGVDLGKSAKTSGTISTIAIIGGGAMLVGGGVLFFTGGGPKTTASRAPLHVGVGPGSVVVRGAF